MSSSQKIDIDQQYAKEKETYLTAVRKIAAEWNKRCGLAPISIPALNVDRRPDCVNGFCAQIMDTEYGGFVVGLRLYYLTSKSGQKEYKEMSEFEKLQLTTLCKLFLDDTKIGGKSSFPLVVAFGKYDRVWKNDLLLNGIGIFFIKYNCFGGVVRSRLHDYTASILEQFENIYQQYLSKLQAFPGFSAAVSSAAAYLGLEEALKARDEKISKTASLKLSQPETETHSPEKVVELPRPSKKG